MSSVVQWCNDTHLHSERPGFDPRWATDLFCPSEPTVTITIGTQLQDSLTCCLFGQKHEDMISSKGVTVSADSWMSSVV